MTDAELQEAKKSMQSLLSKVKGVGGVGIGDGTVRVYIDLEAIRPQIPTLICDVPVEVIVTGGISAF